MVTRPAKRLLLQLRLNAHCKIPVLQGGEDVNLEETGGALPFLGDNGCVVPPHLRPLCSVHVCEMHLGNEAFSETYFEARERADAALWEATMGPQQA